MATHNRLILFEGIPGSGKTTTSKALVDALAHQGQQCSWALEEDRAHPFFGSNVRGRRRDGDYDELCLARWEAVVDSCRNEAGVLEGCAFQNTVRFMYEQGWDTERVEEYWAHFAKIVADVDAKLIYFRHDDVAAFVERHTREVRADVWEKISNHVASTPRGQMLREDNVDDLQIAFWAGYARLCDDLVDRDLLPVLNLDISGGWEAALPLTARWLGGESTAAGPNPSH